MEITKIGDKNQYFFDPMLFDASEIKGKDILKLGIIENGAPCGAAAFQINETRSELLSLYVALSYRRRGAADALMDAFEKMAREANVKSMTVNYIPTDNGINEFLMSRGFEIFESSTTYSFTLAEARDAENLQTYLNQDVSGQCSACIDLSRFHQRALRDYLVRRGFTVAQLLALKFSTELSSVTINEQSQIDSCLLCSDYGDRVCIDIVFSDSCDPKSFLLMFRHLYQKLVKRDDFNVQVTFLTANEQIASFCKQLLGDKLHKEVNAMYAVKLLK